MAKKDGFPLPDEMSFMLMDSEQGAAVPVDSLPREEWERLRSEILWNVGRGISEMLTRGELDA